MVKHGVAGGILRNGSATWKKRGITGKIISYKKRGKLKFKEFSFITLKIT
jgi:hypothetical protein